VKGNIIMIVTFRDSTGLVSIEVDECGIDFDSALQLALFSDGNTDYKVPVKNLVSIYNGDS
jgi:hypothetical protein